MTDRTMRHYDCRGGCIKISLHDADGEVASSKMGWSLDEAFDSVKIKSAIREWDLRPGDTIKIEAV